MERSEVVFGSALIDVAFVDRRWKHRQVLRSIPDWMVDVCQHDAAVGQPTPDGADPAFMEMHLRDLADRLIGQLRLTLEELHDAMIANAANCLYDTWGNAHVELLKVEHDRASSAPARERYGRPSQSLESLSDIDTEALRALIIILCWADALAHDYCDPRLLTDTADEPGPDS